MTTIAVSRTGMAADSQFTFQGLVTKGAKIFKVGSDIIGFCGDVESGIAFVEWKKGGEKPADIDEDFEAYVLTGDGKIFWYGQKLIPVPVKEKFAALGSGSHIAIGSMMEGATPEKAVRNACKVDTGSCLPVVAHNLNNRKKKVK